LRFEDSSAKEIAVARQGCEANARLLGKLNELVEIGDRNWADQHHRCPHRNLASNH
jgi:hypothetical protein